MFFSAGFSMFIEPICFRFRDGFWHCVYHIYWCSPRHIYIYTYISILCPHYSKLMLKSQHQLGHHPQHVTRGYTLKRPESEDIVVTRIFRPVGGVKFRQSEEGVVGWEHQGLPGAMQVNDGGSPVVTMSPWVSICFSTEWFNSMFNFDDLGEAGHLHILHLTKPSTIDKTYHIIRSWEKNTKLAL